MQPKVLEALIEAASLLVVGMAVVFLFLSLLIGAVTLIAWVNGLVPDESLNIESRPTFTNENLSTHQGVSSKSIAAISAAIFQHRRSQ